MRANPAGASGPPFAHLVVRSPWSFRRGATSLDELARTAAERGVGALGIVDRDGLWATPHAWDTCLRHGVRPLVGAELRGEDGQAWVLARTAAGFGALAAASSALATGAVRRLAPLLRARSRGLVVLACEEGLLRALAGDVPRHRLRVALTPGGPRRAPVGLARALDLRLVAVGDVHYGSPGDRDVHRLLRSAALKRAPERLPAEEVAPGEAWLMDERRMRRAFADCPEAVDEAGRIAAGCELDLPRDRGFGRPRLPAVPSGGGRAAQERLVQICRDGLRRRLGSPDADTVGHLERELEQVARLGTAACFLVAAELVDLARERGIAWCGRGEAAATLIAHAIGLTPANPLALGLTSERALGRGASGFPDLDLDLDGRRRAEVLRFVAERHGADRVAGIGTHVAYGARGAVRDLGKVLGLPAAEVAAIGRAVNGRVPAALPEVLARSQRLRGIAVERPPWRQVLQAARAVQDFPRHASVHPGGVVIGPQPLADVVPLFRAPGGDVATQWEAEEVQAAGLFKVDLLGNRALGVLADARRLVLAAGGGDPGEAEPLQDPRTLALLQRGDTVGCTQIESPGTRSVLRQLGCQTLDELMLATAIVRPGVAGSGMMRGFLDRRRARRPAGGPRSPLEELLPATHGVLVFQDDVVHVAHRLCGMPRDQAEALLDALNGRDRAGRLRGLRRAFLDGAQAAGLADEERRALWRQVGSFAGFGLGRAPAANHALLSARAAHLRAHHPAEFMAAVLGYPGGGYAPAAYLSEARRMGLILVPPCVNASEVRYTGRDGTVRVGLMQVSALQPGSARRLVSERRAAGPYTSLADLMARVALEPGELDGLIRCGALDGCAAGCTRAGLLWQRMSLSARGGTRSAGPQLPLVWSVRAPGGTPPAESRLDRMMLEHQSLGLIVSGHPLELFGPFLPFDRDLARDLPDRTGTRVELAGWKISMRTIRTRRGSWMELGAFEDETGAYDVVLLPEIVRRHGNELTRGGPFLVGGVVREDEGHPSVVVRELRLLADPGGVDGEG